MASSTYVLYDYTPNLVCAILLAALFLLTTAIHLWQRIQSGQNFLSPFVVGGTFQIIGYAARAVSHFHPKSTTVYALQTLLILLAPTLYAATIYMTMGRVIMSVHAQHLSIVPVDKMTKIFVCGDILSFILQAASGGVMSGGSSNDLTIGQYIIIGGLGVQLLFFSTFIIVSIAFHARIVRSPTTESEQLRSTRLRTCWPQDWTDVLFGCYAVSALILVRNIYRVVEFAMGQTGYVMEHEVFLYVFDAAMMFCVMVFFNIYHPSLLAKSQERRAECEDGHKSRN